MKRPDWLRLILAGICMFGNQVLFLVGVSFSPAHVASIWQTTQPLITVFLTIVFHLEKKSFLKITGVVLATSGATVITALSGGGTEGRNNLIGSLFFLINCTCSSLYVILAKPLVKRYPVVTVTSLSYNICSLLVLIVGAVMYGNQREAWAIPKTGIWCLAYYVFIHSITTYFLMVPQTMR